MHLQNILKHVFASAVCAGLPGLKILCFLKLFTTQSGPLTPLKNTTFENIVGKGENAGNQHFRLFSQCFLHFQAQISNCVMIILLFRQHLC